MLIQNAKQRTIELSRQRVGDFAAHSAHVALPIDAQSSEMVAVLQLLGGGVSQQRVRVQLHHQIGLRAHPDTPRATAHQEIVLGQLVFLLARHRLHVSEAAASQSLQYDGLVLTQQRQRRTLSDLVLALVLIALDQRARQLSAKDTALAVTGAHALAAERLLLLLLLRTVDATRLLAPAAAVLG